MIFRYKRESEISISKKREIHFFVIGVDFVTKISLGVVVMGILNLSWVIRIISCY